MTDGGRAHELPVVWIQPTLSTQKLKLQPSNQEACATTACRQALVSVIVVPFQHLVIHCKSPVKATSEDRDACSRDSTRGLSMSGPTTGPANTVGRWKDGSVGVWISGATANWKSGRTGLEMVVRTGRVRSGTTAAGIFGNWTFGNTAAGRWISGSVAAPMAGLGTLAKPGTWTTGLEMSATAGAWTTGAWTTGLGTSAMTGA